MHGILSYEERVRLERANGIRPKNECAPCAGGCTTPGDPDMVGKTYADIAQRPQPLRRTCPHPKVIVPVTPALLVTEATKPLEAKMGEAKWRVADFNPCDGRNQGLVAVPNDTEVGHAETVMTATTRVVDNVFDNPHEVKTITRDIQKVKEPKQPIATNATEADPLKGTEDGKTLVDLEKLGEESSEATSEGNHK